MNRRKIFAATYLFAAEMFTTQMTGMKRTANTTHTSLSSNMPSRDL